MKGGKKRRAKQLWADVALRFGLRKFYNDDRRCGPSCIGFSSDINQLFGACMQQMRQRLKCIGERTASAGDALACGGLDAFSDSIRC